MYTIHPLSSNSGNVCVLWFGRIKLYVQRKFNIARGFITVVVVWPTKSMRHAAGTPPRSRVARKTLRRVPLTARGWRWGSGGPSSPPPPSPDRPKLRPWERRARLRPCDVRILYCRVIAGRAATGCNLRATIRPLLPSSLSRLST